MSEAEIRKLIIGRFNRISKIIAYFFFYQSVKKSPVALLAEDIKGTSGRSLADIKVVENTHTQMERRREGLGGGVVKELEVACNKQMER